MSHVMDKPADNILYGALPPTRTEAGDDRRLAECLMPITCRILLSISGSSGSGSAYIDLEQICGWMREHRRQADDLYYPADDVGQPADTSLLLFCLRQRTMELIDEHPDGGSWRLTSKGERWAELVRKYRPEQLGSAPKAGSDE